MTAKRARKIKEEEFDQRMIDIARVTRVVKGGKKMRFRATLAIGDKKGHVGIGIAKGLDVAAAVSKAFIKAKKNMIKVPLNKNGSIQHTIYCKFKAAKILLKPASSGVGVKVGGAVRTILELAGVQNVTGKILGASNKINNVKATLIALSSFKKSKNDKEAVEKNPNEQNISEIKTEN